MADDSAECPQCLENYSSVRRDRHALAYAACGHSACRGCTLDNAPAAPAGAMRCPLCGADTPLARGVTAATLPRNFAVICRDERACARLARRRLSWRATFACAAMLVLLAALLATAWGAHKASAASAAAPTECQSFCARRGWTGTNKARATVLAVVAAGAAVLGNLHPAIAATNAWYFWPQLIASFNKALFWGITATGGASIAVERGLAPCVC
jgi:hypothetical protein